MLANYLSKYKAGLSLFFTIVFSLSGLIWQSNMLARSASTVSEVLDFFTEAFHNLGEGVSRFVDSYGSYSEIKEERDLLREKIKGYRDVHLRMLQFEAENKRLRQLLSLPPVTRYPVIEAEVISQDPDNWFRTIIINKGSADGIEPYMPVVAFHKRPDQNNSRQKKETVQPGATNPQELPQEAFGFDGVITPEETAQKAATQEAGDQLVQGVVGKVIQVNTHSARILPITDQYSRLGVQLKKSGHWALLAGMRPQKEYPRLDYMSLQVFLKKKDEIVTSGGDGIFPKGLTVGYVGENVKRMSSYQQAEVIPAVDFRKLDFVLVIQKKRGVSQEQFQQLTPEGVAGP